MGYSPWGPKELDMTEHEAHHHHTVFHINGVMIENHYDFIEQHSRSSKASIEQTLKNISTTEEHYTTEIDGTKFYIPAPNLNIYFLTMHAGAHFAAENISIRHLTDWALFLKCFGSKVDYTMIINLADEFGFRPFFECLQKNRKTAFLRKRRKGTFGVKGIL